MKCQIVSQFFPEVNLTCTVQLPVKTTYHYSYIIKQKAG